jgi:hypothetical protein
MYAKIVLKHKKLFFERVLSLHPILVLNCLFPHAHELPSFELFEERELFDVVVGVALNKPLP